MNFAYFRKSNFPLNETIENVMHEIKQSGWKHLGSAELPFGQGKMILICRPEWAGKIINEDHNLIGFLPCAISVFRKGNDIMIGSGQPTVLKNITKSQDINKLATEADTQIKSIIHSSAGITELKPSYVKLYSTTTCPYCKMEKSWLDKNGVKHDVVMVDLSQKEAEAMVEKTGQMGVPVTEIGFEDGEPEYIIGFDRPKLSAILGVKG